MTKFVSNVDKMPVKPLVALATLRIAQYDYDERGSERALVRFMAAAEEFSLVGLLLNMVS